MVAHEALLHDVDALARLERQRTFCSTSRMATPSRCSTSMIWRICDTIRGISPSVGSSSRMILGSSIMARAIASICCSHPKACRRPGCAARRARGVGEHRVEQRRLPLFGDAVAVEPGAQVLHNREQAEDAPVLRHIADAEAGKLVRGQAGDGIAVEQHTAWLGCTRPMMVLSVVDLPTPFAAEQAHHFARLHVER